MKTFFSMVGLDLLAGQGRFLSVVGNSVIVKASAAPLGVKYLDETQNIIGEAVGLDLADGGSIGGEFAGLLITSAVNQSVVLVVSSGDFRTGQIVGEVDLSANSSTAAGILSVPAGDVAAIPVSPDRQQLIIQGHESNSWPLILSDVAAYSAAAAGVLVAAGEKLPPLLSAAVVYFHNSSAAIQKVRYFEVLK